MIKKFNVLFVATDTSAVVGLGPSLLGLMSELRDSSINPFVLCPWPGKNELTINPELQKLDIPIFVRHLELWFPPPNNHGIRHLKRFIWGLRERVWSIARLIERHDIHLIHTNALTCIDAALAARLTKRPHLWHMRESPQDNPDIRGYLPVLLAKIIIRKLSQKIIVNSGYLSHYFERVSNDQQVIIVHNGIDLHRFRPIEPPSGILRRELEIAADIPLIGIIGTINPRKGHVTVLKALRRLSDQKINAHVAIIGQALSDYFPSIQTLVSQLDIGKRVHFLGARSDIPELIHDMDILVSASSQETFGRVLVEAMAAAKPVVATRAGGPEEIVVDGETGWLIPVGDAEAMAQKLALLISSPEDRIRMGRAGRRRAEEYFSHVSHARKIEQIILQTMASTAGN